MNFPAMTLSFPRHGAPALSATDLACLRGGRLVFSGLSFRVAPGSALVLRGRNGIGKSSLLRMIAGLVPVLQGRLGFEPASGHGEAGAPAQAETDLVQSCHYLGHLDAFKPVLTVGENLAFWRDYLDDGRHTGIDVGAALEAVGLDALEPVPAGHLSAGQRRRLALARLLAAPRPVWLLDEPTSALDAEGQARLFEIVAAHLAAGGLAVAATHTDLPFGIETLDLTPFAGGDAAVGEFTP